MEPSDVPQGPLSQFQAKRNIKSETLELFLAINKALGEKAIKDEVLERVFNRSWPDFENKLNKISVAKDTEPIERNDKEILKEILDIVRRMERQQTSFDDFGKLILPYALNRLLHRNRIESQAFSDKIKKMIDKGLNPDELVHYLVTVEGIEEVYAKEFVEKEIANPRVYTGLAKKQRG